MAEQEEMRLPVDIQRDVSRAVRILRSAGCTQVFLFGSVAKGSVRNESDLDLAVQGCPRGNI